MQRWPSLGNFNQCLTDISWANLFMLLLSIPNTTSDTEEKEEENEINKQLEKAGF